MTDQPRDRRGRFARKHTAPSTAIRHRATGDTRAAGPFTPVEEAYARFAMLPATKQEPDCVEDSFGDPHEVIHGQLDEHSSWLLMNGQCHSFAAALHNRTGWRFVGIWPDSVTAELRRSWGERWWETSPHHVMLVTPDGRLADARGIHTLDEVEDDTLAGERGYNKGNVLWAASLIDQIMRERF